MKTGQLIEVIDWEGRKLERRIVAICGNLIFVCTDQEFKAARAENREPLAVGWPIDAVVLNGSVESATRN